MAAAPFSNSGLEMWRGYMTSGGGADPSSTGWSGFRQWPNLQGILCGHYVDPVAEGAGHSFWTRIPVTSDSARRQTVQQIFCNLQNLDYVGTPNEGGYTNANYCPGNVLNGLTDIMHLFYLTFRPSQGTVEGALLSANTGLWATGMGNTIPICTSPTPVNLFGTVAYSVPPMKMFPMPSPVKRR
jgi:hypothetical protein